MLQERRKLEMGATKCSDCNTFLRVFVRWRPTNKTSSGVIFPVHHNKTILPRAYVDIDIDTVFEKS